MIKILHAITSGEKLALKRSPTKHRLDHRCYGDAWFLEPLEWEKRYHKQHSKKTLKHTLQRRKPVLEPFSSSGASDAKQLKKLPEGSLSTQFHYYMYPVFIKLIIYYFLFISTGIYIDAIGAAQASQQSKVEEDQALSQLYSTKVYTFNV